MESTSIRFNRENKNIEMQMVIQIPFCNKQKGQDFDIEKSRKHAEAFLFDLIGSFSARIIASLERRMRACQENLVRHLNDIEYADECGRIVYRRKDGSTGTFNVPSFNHMKDAVKALKQSRWRDFSTNPFWVDQTIKALLNDTEQDHNDIGQLKYSDLVSFLCEAHFCGTKRNEEIPF